MLFKNISILDENFEIKEDMYVGIKGNKINYVSSEAPILSFGDLYDGKNKLLMPGFYNAHGHSPMSLMRGYSENLSLQNWLTKKIFPFEEKLYRKAVYWATQLTMAESMRYGIVSTTDMYYFIDDMVRAIVKSGEKCNISRALVNPSGANPDGLECVKEMKETALTYHGFKNDKILVDNSIHAEYTSDERTVRYIAEYTKEMGLGMHVHVSETELETEECKQRHGGKTPIEYFAEVGLFDTRTTAAHCIWINDNDRDILKEKNVNVASNPISNLKLASGICNVPKLYEKGINVAIGTDSVASNNNLDFFEEIKTFALLGKIKNNDPSLMTPKQVLHSATRSGALSQGREDCGLIKEGFKADMIVVDLNVPNMQPIHNTINNLVYSASGKDVCLTMVDGRVLYKDGEYLTIDVESVMYETNYAKNKILGMF
ncbi:MAG: amidohydrolase [Peptostreptococcaceae bacterium]|nr:amidohydrolase [Peptostreptococcaceae bacterium]